MPRLFVALRPPHAVRGALLATQGGVEHARWQDEDQLHLTLRFVGDIDVRAADDLVLALSAVAAPSFTLDVKGAGHFEKRGRPIALWAALAPSPPLSALNRTLERVCQAVGLPPEPRKFVPHITLARLGAHAVGAGDWLVRHGDLAAAPWPVGSFALYESTLHPGGSRYTPVVEWQLHGTPTKST